MTTITALPTPPSRQDPTNFNDRADAFLGALPAFATQTNAVASETNTASANAVAANNAVIAATNITKWVSGTTYANGAVVWSPINGLAYRRITASGSGTTDPSADSTNYKQVNGTGDVSTSGNQTIDGVKTFTNGIALGVDLAVTDGGTGASTANAAFDNLKQSATDSYTGVVSLATAAEAQSGTDTTKVITPASLRNAVNAAGSAPVYAARAWVCFNGYNIPPGILGSGNIYYIRDDGVGNYNVQFQTQMPTANYSVVANCAAPDAYPNNNTSVLISSLSATSFNILVKTGSATSADSGIITLAVFC